MSRLLRGRPGDHAWARPALLALLAATAAGYLAGLSRAIGGDGVHLSN